MKYRYHILIAALVLPSLGASAAFSQEEVFRNGILFGVGARAVGLGGAYAAIGEDYTAGFWNPAALAQIRRSEFTGGLSHLARENNASFINDLSTGAFTDDNITATRLNEAGFVYPFPTYRGSLVVGFGFNRIRSYDSNFALNVFNSLPDDSVGQAWREDESGSLNAFTMSGAMDFSPNLSAGISVNLWSGTDDYRFTQREEDSSDLYTFDSFRSDDIIDNKFRGVNLKLGALYHVNSMLRLAGTVATPTTLTVTEEWQVVEKTTFDSEPDEFLEDSGQFEYKIRSPFTFTGGAALDVAGLLVSGQAEFTDWTQIRYVGDPPIDGLTEAEANDEIRDTYRSTVRFRLGAELTLPGTYTQLRVGYVRDPSPFAIEEEEYREYYSAGIGFLLDKQVKLDFAYVYGNWSEENSGFNDFVPLLAEEITMQKLFGTLSVRF